MTVFEETCLLSCEQWVDSFPSDIPKHKFSKQHNNKMKELLKGNQKKAKYGSLKKTIRFLIIAAILLSFTITAFAISTSREYIITKFFDHSEYNVSDSDNVKQVESLIINYVPEGFAIVDKFEADYDYSLLYSNGKDNFVVDKTAINTSIGYDTEKYDDEIIKINGMDAVYYMSNNGDNGIIYNNGEYIFGVTGNIKKEELIKIAQNIE